MTFDVTILGCGAATPTARHNPSAQVVNMHDKLFLIDCGEGTQMQMRRYKVRFQRINHVFISHLHGDHYLGLMGFISSMHLLGRKNPLHVYAPQALKEIIDISLKASDTYLDYAIEFHPLDTSEKVMIYEDKSLMVFAFPLKHRIQCHGFLFQEKNRQPKVRKEFVDRFKLTPSQILSLKKWEEIETPYGICKPEEACIKPAEERSYAYCSDTAYSEKLIPWITGASLLYHESTFLEAEKDRAKATFHSTAKQAAKIAKQSQVNHLLLGHFSSRYSNDEDFKLEAQLIFDAVSLADEGLLIEVIHQ
jgi:ribonuclease Z